MEGSPQTPQQPAAVQPSLVPNSSVLENKESLVKKLGRKVLRPGVVAAAAAFSALAPQQAEAQQMQNQWANQPTMVGNSQPGYGNGGGFRNLGDALKLTAAAVIVNAIAGQPGRSLTIDASPQIKDFMASIGLVCISPTQQDPNQPFVISSMKYPDGPKFNFKTLQNVDRISVTQAGPANVFVDVIYTDISGGSTNGQRFIQKMLFGTDQEGRMISTELARQRI